MGDSFNALSKREQVGAVASLVFLIGSFLPMVTASASFGAYHISASASSWHSYGTLGVLIGIVGIVIWFIQRFQIGNLPEVGPGWPVIAAGLIALGTLIVFIRAVTVGDGTSLGWGLFVLIIGGVVAAVSFGTNFDPQSLSRKNS